MVIAWFTAFQKKGEICDIKSQYMELSDMHFGLLMMINQATAIGMGVKNLPLESLDLAIFVNFENESCR